MTAADVDAYLAGFDGDRRVTLDRLRALIRDEAPDADESISYHIPTYKIAGKRMIYFAGWAEHYSLYPLGPRIPELLADELRGYSAAAGTVRIPWTEFPEQLLRGLVRLRREDAARGR